MNALLKGGNATPGTAMATNLLQLLIRQHFNRFSDIFYNGVRRIAEAAWLSDRKYPNNNRAYFTNADTVSLGGGIELWRGFFQ